MSLIVSVPNALWNPCYDLDSGSAPLEQNSAAPLPFSVPSAGRRCHNQVSSCAEVKDYLPRMMAQSYETTVGGSAMRALSDEELVSRYRLAPGSAASDGAIEELFQRYHTRVARWCYRFSGDREAAADMAQEIFLKAFRHLASFRGDSRFSTWLYMIARNHCRNEWKARGSSPESNAEPLLELAAETAAIEAELVQASNVAEMRRLLSDTLDDTELRVLTLHFGHEFSLAVVTRLLGLTNTSGAKAYIVSAKRKLTGAVRRWKAAQSRGKG
jgi:RNA polymerase sigma-70 factor (ECF subfamily)